MSFWRAPRWSLTALSADPSRMSSMAGQGCGDALIACLCEDRAHAARALLGFV
jgi:hypothetical protein